MGLMKSTYRLDFSDFNQPGTYYLKAGKAVSPRFPINNHVYNGTADFLLNYMRQQRCGYNPFLKDSCHVHDGYILYHPTKQDNALMFEAVGTMQLIICNIPQLPPMPFIR